MCAFEKQIIHPGPFIYCTSCFRDISTQVYAKCINCDKLYCLWCFAKGTYKRHSRYHEYELFTGNRTRGFEDTWSMEEEMALIKAIHQGGSLQGWKVIAEKVRTKDSEQCQAHFERCYLNSGEAPFPSRIDALSYEPYEIPPPKAEMPTCEATSEFAQRVGYRPIREECAKLPFPQIELLIRDIVITEDDSEESFLQKIEALEKYDKAISARAEIMENVLGDGSKEQVRVPPNIPQKFLGLVDILDKDTLMKILKKMAPAKVMQIERCVKAVQAGAVSLDDLELFQEYENFLSRGIFTPKALSEWNEKAAAKFVDPEFRSDYYKSMLSTLELQFIEDNKISPADYIQWKTVIVDHLIVDSDADVTSIPVNDVLEEHIVDVLWPFVTKNFG